MHTSSPLLCTIVDGSFTATHLKPPSRPHRRASHHAVLFVHEVAAGAHEFPRSKVSRYYSGVGFHASGGGARTYDCHALQRRRESASGATTHSHLRKITKHFNRALYYKTTQKIKQKIKTSLYLYSVYILQFISQLPFPGTRDPSFPSSEVNRRKRRVAFLRRLAGPRRVGDL